MPKSTRKTAEDRPTIGLVGLGLMGQGIAACLVAYGFTVVAYDQKPAQGRSTVRHVAASLEDLVRRRLIKRAAVGNWKPRLRAVSKVGALAECGFVIETVTENLPLKRQVHGELERVLAPDAIIASNTSSFPIALLQKDRQHPERYIGMHWGEPAQIMRYLEIIPGPQTAPETIARTRQIGERCGKRPTVLKDDIRGFLSNRMMYAMIREAFHLVEAGVADIETVDQSFRNDIGWWALLAGPFRWMDLTGIPAYEAVMEGLLPELSNRTEVPALMRQVTGSGAKGVANARGFYPYTKQSAKQWEKAWVDFTYDTRKLADKYAAFGC